MRGSCRAAAGPRPCSAGTGAGARELADVAAAADGVVRTIGVLAADRGISVEAAIDPAHQFAGAAADLEEMLGNLLDNAAKWARRRVELASAFEDGHLLLTVDDDGPGLRPEARDQAFSRGARLDERVPGNGLGLAIVRDLTELYGGQVVLGSHPWAACGRSSTCRVSRGRRPSTDGDEISGRAAPGRSKAPGPCDAARRHRRCGSLPRRSGRHGRSAPRPPPGARPLGGPQLGEDVDAVAILADHLGDAADLTLDPLQSVRAALFGGVLHVLVPYPPRV